jgi:two-component system, cell cycle response regulator
MDEKLKEITTASFKVGPITPIDASSERKACFIMVAGNDLGKIYNLDRDLITIGRGAENDIVVREDSISRNHAQVYRRGRSGFGIRDLGSTNGTFCNGQRIVEKELEHGDKVMLGSATVLKYTMNDLVDSTYHEKLFNSAVRDWLTQCYNKKYFEEHFDREFTTALRDPHDLALIFFDIDHFKDVNDTHGHLIGDYLLTRLCRLIAPELPSGSMFARYGGEEFIVVLPRLETRGAVALAERLRALVAEHPFEFEGVKLQVTISLGVVGLREGKAGTAKELLRQVDELVYRAKHNGRNRVEYDDTAAPTSK